MKLRAAAIAVLLSLAGCGGSQDIDKASQYGSNPNLPEPTRGLLPNMHVRAPFPALSAEDRRDIDAAFERLRLGDPSFLPAGHR